MAIQICVYQRARVRIRFKKIVDLKSKLATTLVDHASASVTNS
jgi:hypothetical protein